MNRRLMPPNLTVCLLFVACLLMTSCRQEIAATAPPSVTKVTAAKPLVMSLVEWDEYTGRLDAIDSVEVRARVDGYLASIHFDEGHEVEKGDLLAIIDPRPFEAELNAAKARLEESQAKVNESQALLKQAEAEQADTDAQFTLANQRLDRAQSLSQREAITQEELDVRQSEQLQAKAATEASTAKIESAKAGIATATAAIDTAKASLETAALNLQYTQIRAPISGRISRRNVTEGNLISGGSNQSTLLTTIVSLNPIHVNFDANEQEFLKYVRLARAGTRESSRDVKNPVYVALIDETGFPHTGHMDFVDNRVDPNTGTMRGRAILTNDEGLLTPGLFVKLRLPGSGRYEAVLIADSAIGSDQSEKFVYVVDNENTVKRQPVELGPISHGLRIIRDGLTGSETVITRGLQRIAPDAKVDVTEETIEPQPSQLPDDYEPVPREQWLSRQPDDIPEDVKPNAQPYRELESGVGDNAPQESAN